MKKSRLYTTKRELKRALLKLKGENVGVMTVPHRGFYIINRGKFRKEDMIPC